ncbi:MAG: MBL fold metallo-hydrolase RNA specificity domain-containing protein, partial [bacterium]
DVIRVLGQEVPLRAHVEVLNGYSAHGDRTELSAWLDAVRQSSPHLSQVCLVHGEPAAQDAFSARLRANHYAVICPEAGDTVTVGGG